MLSHTTNQSEGYRIFWGMTAIDGLRVEFFIFLTHSNMEDSKNTKPVDVIRLRGVSASIFANKAKDRALPLYKVSMKRTYRKDGEFKSVTALGRDDLPIAAMLLSKAWERILELEGEHWNEADQESADKE
jgi:hypothetical protein